MQWDLSRSVPRKVNEVSVYTGDIQGLVTGGGCLYSCGADGSIRSWQVGGLAVLGWKARSCSDTVHAPSRPLGPLAAILLPMDSSVPVTGR